MSHIDVDLGPSLVCSKTTPSRGVHRLRLMRRDPGYCTPAMTVNCDNPGCNTLYDVSDLPAGHTFTCSRCGSKVTVRGPSPVAKPAQLAPRWSRSKGNGDGNSSTPLLDAIVSTQEQRSKSRMRAVIAALILIIAAIGVCAWYVAYCPSLPNPHRAGASDAEIPVASTTPTPIPTLQYAIASGEIVAKFSGTGGSSGDSVKVRVAKGANAGSGTITVMLPAGSVLVSDDPSAQSMMVASVLGVDLGGNSYRPESQILLSDNKVVDYILAAYCTQFEKENPSSSTRFSLKRPDPVFACIAERGPSLTVPAMQAAVWMTTDSITYTHMKQKFPVTSQEWAAGQSVYQECRNARNADSGVAP